MSFVSHEKRIVITGGSGFLGSTVVRKLRQRGCNQVIIPRRATCDLSNANDVARLSEKARPNLVLHVASVADDPADGGTPAESFYRNVLMNTLPELSRRAFGVSKRLPLIQAQAYRRQYGFLCVHAIPTSLYGPGDRSAHQRNGQPPRAISFMWTPAREGFCWCSTLRRKRRGESRKRDGNRNSRADLQDCATGGLFGPHSLGRFAAGRVAPVVSRHHARNGHSISARGNCRKACTRRWNGIARDARARQPK